MEAAGERTILIVPCLNRELYLKQQPTPLSEVAIKEIDAFHLCEYRSMEQKSDRVVEVVCTARA